MEAVAATNSVFLGIANKILLMRSVIRAVGWCRQDGPYPTVQGLVRLIPQGPHMISDIEGQMCRHSSAPDLQCGYCRRHMFPCHFRQICQASCAAPPLVPPDRSRLRVASRSSTFGRQCVWPAALGSHVLKPGLGAVDFVARLRARRQVAFRSGIQVFALGGLAHTDAVGRRHLQSVSRILVGWCRFPGRLARYFGSTGSGVRAVGRWHCGAPASLPLRAKAGFVALLASTDL